MATSPTQLTLARLRKDGWDAEVTERWIPQARVRKDLFGFIDVLAMTDNEVLAVQATSYSHVSTRANKIRNCALFERVGRHFLIQVWGWRKVKNRWVCRIVAVEPTD